MDRRCFVLAALALGGCATVGDGPVGGSAHGPLEELEPLFGVRADHEGLTIRTTSRGCTTKPDFTFYVERRGGTIGIAFARRQVDACKAAAGEVDIVFSWTELGLEPGTPMFVLNPVAARVR